MMPAVPVVETKQDLVVFAIPSDRWVGSDEQLLKDGWWNLFAYLATARFEHGLFRNSTPPYDIEFAVFHSADQVREHGYRHMCEKCERDMIGLIEMFESGGTRAAVLCEFRTDETTYIEPVPQRTDDAESA
jgi:hypothetical protein